jgi:NTP pyrophosphatase (non-canonical NTP hydrolase)
MTEHDITADDYQAACLRTSNGYKQTRNERLQNNVLGLCGESGEIADHVKKALHHGHGLDRDQLIEECGDLLWYVVATLDTIDCTLAEAMQRNIAKLRKRYPDGFSPEASINRTD